MINCDTFNVWYIAGSECGSNIFDYYGLTLGQRKYDKNTNKVNIISVLKIKINHDNNLEYDYKNGKVSGFVSDISTDNVLNKNIKYLIEN